MSKVKTMAARREKYEGAISDSLRDLYGGMPGFDAWLAEIFEVIHASVEQRPQYLLDLDERRETTDRGWYLRPDMVAYMCYADRFAQNFAGVEGKIPYLKELGITYLHLLSALKPRTGHNDGGFAIADYNSANPRYGSMDDLEHLNKELQKNGVSPCIDFVFNHTAMEHEWAQKALAGDPYYKDFYYFFEDEATTKEYEKNLGQVFPETSPGNFTYFAEAKSWVWTTFYYYQWDLNYKNPNVFMEMLKAMLFLANKGIEVFRLDATAYLWKKKGTNCLNLPETHKLLQVFRAVMSLAAPAVCLKAEAIVGARYISKYLGDPRGEKPECQLSYHNALMAALWDSLATGETVRMSEMLKSLPRKPRGTSWITYLRCHDDIGWSVLTDDQGASWAAGHDHLRMLSDFYEGKGENSFARGRAFQLARNAAFHGTNGTLASLSGLEKAVEEQNSADTGTALSRIKLLYKIIFAYGGVPLVYMGEEIGLFNDYDYNKQDPVKDGRWLHRPDFSNAVKATDVSLKQTRAEIFTALREIAGLRKTEPLLHADVSTLILDSGNSHIFAFLRKSARGLFLVLANFLPEKQSVQPGFAAANGLDAPLTEQFANIKVHLSDGLTLAPYQCLWLKA